MATSSYLEMSATLRPAPMSPEDPEHHKTGHWAGFTSNINNPIEPMADVAHQA
jgi:hypothetical protein